MHTTMGRDMMMWIHDIILLMPLSLGQFGVESTDYRIFPFHYYLFALRFVD